MITIICAMDKNGLIGSNNKLPWHHPEDIQWFKENTMNTICIMGRNTYESIPNGLPGRQCYILSKSKFKPKYGVRFPLKSQILQWMEVGKHYNINYSIIGGAQIYKEFLNVADRLLITHINKEFEGDVFFPLSKEELKQKYDSMVIKESGDLTFIEYFKKVIPNEI